MFLSLKTLDGKNWKEVILPIILDVRSL